MNLLLPVMIFNIIPYNGLEVGPTRRCRLQSDCIAKGSERCSICVDKDDDQSGRCVYIYPSIYSQTPACERFDDRSCPLNCNGRGKCSTGGGDAQYYPPYCHCHEPFYGENCQHVSINGESLVSYVRQIFHDPFVPAGEDYFIDFDICSKHVHLLDIHVKSDNMPLHYKLIHGDQKENSRRLSQQLHKLVVKSVFPHKNHKKMYTNGDNYIGYKTPISIYLHVNSVLIFNNTWEIFISYELRNYKCLPKLTILNCAKEITDSVTFVRGNSAFLEINVKHIADGNLISKSQPEPKCKDSDILSWKIWKLNLNETFSLSLYENDIHCGIIAIGPYKLYSGEYLAQVQVKDVRRPKSLINIESCYFNIICKPITAKISGGNARKVSPYSGILLIADQSFDPNMPPNMQDHVNIQWSCVNLEHPEGGDRICEPKQMQLSQHYFIPPTLLVPAVVYNFTLKVWTNLYNNGSICDANYISPAFAFVIIEVSNYSERKYDEIVIECRQNCNPKVNPSEKLIVKARKQFVSNEFLGHEYSWGYYINNERDVPTDVIQLDGLPSSSHVLVINENTFEPDSKYAIVVRSELLSKEQWYAKYYFETSAINFEASCSIAPNAGVKGLTIFEIQCMIENNASKSSFRFEFYDKNDEESREPDIYNGRLLGTSNNGCLMDVRLTRGNVFVYIFNENGLILKKIYKHELTSQEVTNIILIGMYKNITNQIQFGCVPTILGSISVIPDLVSAKIDDSIRADMLNELIGLISKLHLNRLEDMKLCTSTLVNVLLTLHNRNNQLQMKLNFIEITLRLIKQQANILYNKIINSNFQNKSPEEVKQITLTLLKCLQAVVSCKLKETENKPYSYDFIKRRQVSIHFKETIELMQNTLSYFQSSELPSSMLSTNDDMFVMWVLEIDYGYDITKILSKEQTFPVIINDKLIDYISHIPDNNERIILQVLSIKENICWWASDVQSQLVFITLKRKLKHNDLLPITGLLKPIEVVLDLDSNLSPAKVCGTTKQRDPKMDALSLDLSMKVHRFDPPLGSLMTIHFLFPPTNDSLRVIVMDQCRPDYKTMMKRSTEITKNSPFYQVPYYNYIDPYRLYMGITPGTNVLVNKTVTYTFEINATVCKIWQDGQWNAGCRVKKIESNKHVHCECTDLSIVAAAFPEPLNTIDEFMDARLFLTIFENILIADVVALLVFLYVLSCLFLCRSDKNSKFKRNVIILPDNFPYDEYPYLIAVFTGHSCYSGTSSRVGLKIIGTRANSHAHILSSEYRNILQNNSDDWFLIYCRDPLGDVCNLHIWHDNSGYNPEWLLKKIIVYDLLENTKTVFIVNEWIALSWTECPEAYLLPVSSEDITNVNTCFINNIHLGFMQFHVLSSCFFSHPRSCMTRLQRMSILMCWISLAICCSTMFYLPSGLATYYDDYNYSITEKELYCAIVIFGFSKITTFVLIALFNKGHTMSNNIRRSTLRLRVLHSSYSISAPIIYSYKNVKQTSKIVALYNIIVQILIRSSLPCKIQPVQLYNKKPIVETQCILWLICAWILSTTLITFCLYISILNGLKLGLVQTKKCLSSVIIAVGGEILILGPVRIFVISILLAIGLQHVSHLDSHEVGIENLTHIEIPHDPEYVNGLLELRRQIIYKPIQTRTKKNVVQSKDILEEWWIVIDFINARILILIVAKVIFMLWISQSKNNSHIVRMMALSSDELLPSVEYFIMANDSSFQYYLNVTFLSSLYNVKWYNSRPLSSVNSENGYWTADFTNRMLGLPVIRQLRVIPKTCENIVLKKGRCIPLWTSGSEEKDDYAKGWSATTRHQSSTPDSPWKYTETPQYFLFNRMHRLYSPLGHVYTSGGYMVILPPTIKETELNLAQLSENKWLDKRTRAVFVESSIYNVNEDVFTQMTIMVEYLISNSILIKARAFSVKTRPYLNIWNVSFVVMVVYYLFRCVCLMNQQGLRQFLSQLNNVCRIMIVIVGFLSILLFHVHYYSTNHYAGKFVSNRLGKHFDIDYFSLYFLMLRYVMSVLLIFVMVHALALLKFGRPVITILYTLKLSVKWIIWNILILAVISLSLVNIAALTNILTLYKLENIIANNKSLSSIKLSHFQYVHLQIFIITKTVLLKMYSWCFIINYICYFYQAKLYKARPSDSFNVITFVLSRLRK